jgi:hypothetical protein
MFPGVLLHPLGVREHLIGSLFFQACGLAEVGIVKGIGSIGIVICSMSVQTGNIEDCRDPCKPSLDVVPFLDKLSIQLALG